VRLAPARGSGLTPVADTWWPHGIAGRASRHSFACWLVTGLLVGLGLAITTVGIPILTLVLASVRPLLGSDLPSTGLAPHGECFLGGLKAYWTDSTTWRGVGYLLARFPVGAFTFTVVVVMYASALYLIAAPVIAPFDTIELGFWDPNTWYEGLALAPLGLVLLVASGWVSEGMAAMSRGLARWGTR